jgi:hypothetical protein
MADVERLREFVSSTPELDYFRKKAAAGWRLVSVDWERDVPVGAAAKPASREEVPFGLRVADDCQYLTDHVPEKKALIRMMELIVKDQPLSVVAEELNRGGYRTRKGLAWTPLDLFELLPRLIEAGPKIFNDEDYVARRHHI